MRKLLVILVLALLPLQAGARSRYEGMDAQGAFASILSSLSDRTFLPVSDLTVEVALLMLGTPYVAGTLEAGPEALVVRYDATDCILFVETCLATALTIKGVNLAGDGCSSDTPSFSLLCDNLRMLRYRGGIVGYATREHYTSGWLRNAGELGVLREYSGEVGKRKEQTFSFMSTHPESYRQLADNPELVGEIRAMEDSLAKFRYHWVPADMLAGAEEYVRTGDIVCFVTGVEGLDISHVALAYEKDGRKCFIHASSAAGRVILDDRSIAEYAKYGVRLARPLR